MCSPAIKLTLLRSIEPVNLAAFVMPQNFLLLGQAGVGCRMAGPLHLVVLISQNDEMEERTVAKTFYIEDENGAFYSEDKTKRYSRLQGAELKEYLGTQRDVKNGST